MQDLLSQLHDIQLPDPVGWWPLAFSWWILIFSITSILVGILWYYLDLKKRNAYRVTAMKQLQQIMDSIEKPDIDKIAKINTLLKQVALTAYGRKKTAALQSQDWINFLAETCSYIPQPENLLDSIELGYRDYSSARFVNTLEALQSVHDYAKKWIKGHHQ